MSFELMITPSFVRSALQKWHTTHQLGKNEMVRLTIVARYRESAGYSPTDAGRGMALRRTLQEVIEEMRPDGEVEVSSKVWRPYLVITRHFIAGEHRDTVMDELYIAQRTFYQAVNNAVEQIVDRLSMLEEESHVASVPESHRVEPVGLLTFVPPLPAQPLSVRPDDIEQVKQTLLAGEDVACSGLPGIGKTTLCSYIAHDDAIQAHFVDGILWAGLGRNPDLGSILGEWGGVLGIAHYKLDQVNDVVGRARLVHQAIGVRRMLLIIDDAWDGAAAFALQVGGEQCVHLLTSRYAPVALDFSANHIPLAELTADVSVQFLHKLAPILIQSAPKTLHTLNDMVGGLPLALMLIGRHIRRHSFNPEQVSAIISALQSAETRLNLTLDHHPLHRRPDLIDEESLSLYSVINLSYERLPTAEQVALCDLTLFPPRPNTFSEAAVLAVIDQPRAVLDGLIANGLLEVSGNGRYTIHQTIADFGAVQADYHDEATVRFLRWHGAPSEPVDFDLDANNLRQAIQLALAHNHPLLGAKLFDTFDQFFARRGLLQEQRAYLEQLYTLAIDDACEESEKAIAYIAFWFGSNCTQRRDHTSARTYLEQALERFEAHNLIDHQLRTIGAISLVCQRLGQLEDGYHYSQAGLALCERFDKPKSRIGLYSSLAFSSFQRGRYAEAKDHIKQVLADSEALGTADQQLIAKSNLAWIMAHLGDHADCVEAVSEYTLLLEHATEINHVAVRCLALNGLVVAGGRLGDWAVARTAADDVLPIVTTFSTGLLMRTKRVCGYAATVWGQYGEAELLYDDAMREVEAYGDKLEMVALLNQRSHLSRLQGRFDEAIMYAQTALTMAETIQIPPMKAAALHHLGTAQLGMGQETTAYDSLYQALTIYQSLDLHHFTIPLRARLAQCAVLQGDTAKAQTQIKPVLDYIKLCALKAVQDRGEIYEIVQDVLRVCGDDETAASLTW